MKKRNNILTLLIALALVACGTKTDNNDTLSGLNLKDFQTEIDGKATNLYTLKNDNGMEVCVTNFGGRVVSIMVPDRNGVMQDVVLGFDNIQDYIDNPTDFGATIGRYANRIDKGRFTLNGNEYDLPKNNYGHCLHGGPKGYQYQIFDTKQFNSQQIEFTYLSKDGEEGFPGNLTCRVLMTLTNDNALDIEYIAQTDAPTIVNMTNHSYFNLDGDAKSNATQLLTINSDQFTPVDSTFMTTGEILNVAGTPMDFRQPTAIGDRINDYSFEQLKNGNGYDHNWILNTNGDTNEICATLYSPTTGISMDVFTNEPGIQFYSGNFLDGSLVGKKGVKYNQRASTCLETQKYPDTPNKLQWPSAVLNPGENYVSRCIYRFSVR